MGNLLLCHGSISTFIATLEIAHEESLVSFDFVSLFTRVRTSLAIQVAKQHLESDTHLAERSFLAITEIITLLKFCLDLDHLSSILRVLHGRAMASPV